MAFVKGSAVVGGTYDETATPAFTNKLEYTFEYGYKKPDWDSLTQGSSLNADIRLILLPVVYITAYDLLTVEAEIMPYVGVTLEKYEAGSTTTRQAPCASGTGADLWYSLYYGADAVFRLQRPTTPASWDFISDIQGMIGGLVLACRTSSDAHSITASGLSVEIIAAGSTVMKNTGESGYGQSAAGTCADDTNPMCVCMWDTNLYRGSSCTSPTTASTSNCYGYLLRYPKTGLMTILAKTNVAAVTGCISVPTAAEVAATINTKSITYPSLTDFASQKANLEKGMGIFLGIHDGTNWITQGGTTASVTASASRRSSTVSYAAVVPPAYANQAQVTAQTMTANDANTALTAGGVTGAGTVTSVTGTATTTGGNLGGTGGGSPAGSSNTPTSSPTSSPTPSGSGDDDDWPGYGIALVVICTLLLLAGIGLIGFAATRKKAAPAQSSSSDAPVGVDTEMKA